MAFDSATSLIVNKPTLEFIVDSWRFSSTTPSITLSSGLNSFYVNYTLPTVTISSTLPIQSVYTANITTKMPSVIFRGANDITGSILYNTPKIVLAIQGTIPNAYASSWVMQIPTVGAVTNPNGVYTLNRSMRIPNISVYAVLTGTTVIDSWTLNTITDAHSKYSNYKFNSFFKLGKDTYGVNSNGSIYKLGGDVDFGTELTEAQIDAYVTLPTSNFEDQENKMCSDAFVYGRVDGDLDVNLKVDEQEERTIYTISYDDRAGMHRRRVKIPRGLLGNAWEYKLKNVDGSNFDINQFELFVRSVKRVIR